MHVPDGFKHQHPEIDWKGITGFRNILVHDYLGEIDANTVLVVIDKYLPPLEKTIQNILQVVKDK